MQRYTKLRHWIGQRSSERETFPKPRAIGRSGRLRLLVEGCRCRVWWLACEPDSRLSRLKEGRGTLASPATSSSDQLYLRNLWDPANVLRDLVPPKYLSVCVRSDVSCPLRCEAEVVKSKREEIGGDRCFTGDFLALNLVRMYAHYERPYQEQHHSPSIP